MKANEDTRYVVLHAADLDIGRVHVYSPFQLGGRWQEVRRQKVEGYYQYYVFELDNVLNAGGTYMMEIDYTGNLTTRLDGYYRSVYKNQAGEETWIGTTQFEPTDARRAFPCFDEPAMKANFTIHLGVHENFHALSNMPVASIENLSTRITINGVEQGYRVFHFEESVPMSTYLVAFVLSDFEYKAKTTKNGVEVRVFATADAVTAGLVDFALEMGVRTLEYYEDYFGVPYPLPKEDLIAIPDFAAGAMENWGLITYRDTALLLDVSGQTSSPANLQRVAVVIAHELAHQWFGNLVTMEWWTDLWLNEGFASYVEYLGTNHSFPQWDMPRQFLFQDEENARQRDSLLSTHSLSAKNIETPSQINSLFDDISYSKGASIIRQFNAFFGEEVFRAGLKSYLQKYSYSNARSTMLWAEIESAAHARGWNGMIMPIVDGWTNNAGYPIVTMKSVDDALLGGILYNIKQERFFSDGTNSSDDSSIWSIPFNYEYSYSGESTVRETSMLLTAASDEVAIGTPMPLSWVKGNAYESALIVVNYGAKEWEAIRGAMTGEGGVRELDVEDKEDVISSAFLLHFANVEPVNADILLPLLSTIQHATDYSLWAETIRGLSTLIDKCYQQSYYGQLHAFILSLIEPVALSLSYPSSPEPMGTLAEFGSGEGFGTARLTSAMFAFGESVGLPNITSIADVQFLAFLERAKATSAVQAAGEMSSITRPTVLKAAVKRGGDEGYNTVLALYEHSTSASLQREALTALALATEPWEVARSINLVLDGVIRSQDSLRFLEYIIGGSIVGREAVWRLMNNDWARLTSGREGLFNGLGGLIVTMAKSYNTEFDLDQVKSFIEAADVSETSKQTAVSALQANINYLRNNGATLDAWLKQWAASA
uniref:Aminopeptidase n=1 Tax=Palpitomonas bilix TaxID=652834 RepID=A0A7S3G765_9EUKA